MRESAWVGAGFVLQYSAQAARAVFLTRILTPHALGIYFVLRAIAVAGSMATQLGLGTVGLRRVAAAGADHAGIRAALRGVFILTAQTSVVGTLLAILAGWATGLALVDAALVGLMLAALTWTATLADLGRGLGRTATVSGIGCSEASRISWPCSRST
jgi:O-antigen/teichoic acid export membrane protein